MPRAIVLGVVGDSGAGKTTITRGLLRVLGERHVTHISADDYHRYDRASRRELGITPLHPDCNYMDIMGQDMAHLRRGNAILKPVYRHADGTFGPPMYVEPHAFTVVEGLLGYHTPQMREADDEAIKRARVYVDTRRGALKGDLPCGALRSLQRSAWFQESCRGGGTLDPGDLLPRAGAWGALRGARRGLLRSAPIRRGVREEVGPQAGATRAEGSARTLTKVRIGGGGRH